MTFNDPGVRLVKGGQGYFQISITHPGGTTKDVTFFRGVPTKVDSFSSADPFGDSTASISFDAITSFDTPGAGDLWWLVPWAQVTIFWWDVVDGVAVRNSSWVWEGFLASEEIASPYSVQCKGTLYLYDNYLAIPFFPSNPVPYEKMIQRLFATLPTKWNKALKIEWPYGWHTKVPQPDDPAFLWFLKPWGVKVGELWSGLTTRDTGSWEPVLTSYIQTLLTTMYTPDGDQWTVMKAYGRQPVLKVRQPVSFPDDTTLVVYNEAPGIKVSLSRDYSMSANVVFGTGQDLAGTAFSGAQVYPDGETTWYEPFAALPQVYPVASSNPRRISTMIRKESRIQFSPGVDQAAAREVAMTQIRRFADPGLTGSISLESDPLLNEQPFNRLLLTAGRQIQVRNLRGTDVMFHISSVTVSPETGQVSLTVDSKFRDALTVNEVRARTRDALDPVSMLKAGKLSAASNDVLKPWSYSEGSGVIPSGGKLDATVFFTKMTPGIAFPWTEWTKKYPPSKKPEYYIKVHRKSARATDRWQDYGWTTGNKVSRGVPVKGAQQASIRLTQIAAYDKNGNLLPIHFHVGFYSLSTISNEDMPRLTKAMKGLTGTTYAAGQTYPFFPDAFNTTRLDGTQTDKTAMIGPGAIMHAAWGTMDEPAGYWPSTRGSGGHRTGMLVDETSWSLDATQSGSFDFNKPANNKTEGMWYVMIYQDEVEEAYFLGRCFRGEIGIASA